MPEDEDERLQTELSLLDAMYPSQVVWNDKAREMKYRSDGRSFHLRVPDGYLAYQLPEVLSATLDRADMREALTQFIRSCDPGEEILDSIILAINELVPPVEEKPKSEVALSHASVAEIDRDSTKCTVIIWLHHLLNTNKRKQALSPPSQDVSGITKPGYPGVLVYSGSRKAVHEHINELKRLNWQAFQIRFESDEEWTFAHGSGVMEVEAMKDVVAEIGQARKAEFMEAMRMK